MPSNRTWQHVSAASVALLGLLLVVSAVRAQDDPDPPQDPANHYYYQFYGFARDVTIDGDPLQEGDSITPIVNGEAVKTAMIPENGFFVTFKQDFNLPPIGACQVVYLINSQQHKEPLRTDEFSYPAGCGDIEVKLALVTSNGNVAADDGSQDSDESTPVAQAGQPDDTAVLEDEQPPETEGALPSESTDDDLLEESSASEEPLAEADQSSPAGAVLQAEPPETPNLGTGGLKAAQSDPKWSVVAAMIVLTVSAIACALLLIRRRNDQSPR